MVKLKNIKQRIMQSIYFNSFRNLSPKLFIILLYDVLFIILSMLISQGFSYLMGSLPLDTLTELQYNLSQAVSETDAGQSALYNQQLSSIFTALISYLVLFVVVLLLNWSVWRMMIYDLLYGNKFEAKRLFKFFATNIVITIIILAIIFIVVSAFKTTALPAVMFILLLLFIYLLVLFYNLLFYTNNIRSAIRLTFTEGFRKIHKFGSAALLIILTWLVLLLPFSVLSIALPEYTRALLYFIPMLLTLAWGRIYFAEVVKRIIPKPKK